MFVLIENERTNYSIKKGILNFSLINSFFLKDKKINLINK